MLGRIIPKDSLEDIRYQKTVTSSHGFVKNLYCSLADFFIQVTIFYYWLQTNYFKTIPKRASLSSHRLKFYYYLLVIISVTLVTVGRLNEIVAPILSSLILLSSAHILPPWACIILLQINNPKPVP